MLKLWATSPNSSNRFNSAVRFSQRIRLLLGWLRQDLIKFIANSKWTDRPYLRLVKLIRIKFAMINWWGSNNLTDIINYLKNLINK